MTNATDSALKSAAAANVSEKTHRTSASDTGACHRGFSILEDGEPDDDDERWVQREGREGGPHGRVRVGAAVLKSRMPGLVDDGHGNITSSARTVSSTCGTTVSRYTGLMIRIRDG